MELHTSNLWINLIIFAFGFYILIKGSDLFIDAAAALARKWHISELVIGLTLVSIGTSLPELSSSLYAAATGEPEFVFGNVAGSCTTNITLILGLGIFLAGWMNFPIHLLKRDAVVMLGCFLLSTLSVFFLTVPGKGGMAVPGMPRWFGWLFLLLAAAYCCYLMKNPEELEEELSGEEHTKSTSGTAWKHFFLLTLGFIMILAGSKLLVDVSVWGAEKLNVSTLVISSTVVALGTSLPELAVTIAGVLKKKSSLAIGNIIGSDIFNILLIFGGCAAIRPLDFSAPAVNGNLYMMLGSGLLLTVFMITGRKLSRWEGAVLFLLYPGFILYNIGIF